LPYLKAWTNKRIGLSKRYNSNLKDLIDIKIPKTNSNSKHVFHLFVIRTEKRNELMGYFSENEIDTAIHYPVSLPFLECYKELNFSINQFPNAFKIQSEILSLPMYAELEDNQVEKITNIITSFFNK
jgi:dTDP-4-amino-4,6-dideoxygalactose transaminase